MPDDAASKKQVTARAAETGESYTEALMAVMAEDNSVTISIWFPEHDRKFELDTPEAQYAWRELDKADDDAIDDFARTYLGEDLQAIGTSITENCRYSGMVIAVEGEYDTYDDADRADMAARNAGCGRTGKRHKNRV